MGRTIKRTALTGKQQMALALLVRGKTIKEVAQDMRVTRDTIQTWQRSPIFQETMQSYIASVARAELDRGLEEGQLELNAHTSSIVQWMTGVVLGTIELKPNDKQRWRMALDLLHHAGIIDKQAALKSEMPNAASFTLNQTLDQRKQAILAPGNQDLSDQLERFRKPAPRLV